MDWTAASDNDDGKALYKRLFNALVGAVMADLTFNSTHLVLPTQYNDVDTMLNKFKDADELTRALIYCQNRINDCNKIGGNTCTRAPPLVAARIMAAKFGYNPIRDLTFVSGTTSAKLTSAWAQNVCNRYFTYARAPKGGDLTNILIMQPVTYRIGNNEYYEQLAYAEQEAKDICVLRRKLQRMLSAEDNTRGVNATCRAYGALCTPQSAVCKVVNIGYHNHIEQDIKKARDLCIALLSTPNTSATHTELMDEPVENMTASELLELEEHLAGSVDVRFTSVFAFQNGINDGFVHLLQRVASRACAEPNAPCAKLTWQRPDVDASGYGLYKIVDEPKRNVNVSSNRFDALAKFGNDVARLWGNTSPEQNVTKVLHTILKIPTLKGVLVAFASHIADYGQTSLSDESTFRQTLEASNVNASDDDIYESKSLENSVHKTALNAIQLGPVRTNPTHVSAQDRADELKLMFGEDVAAKMAMGAINRWRTQEMSEMTYMEWWSQTSDIFKESFTLFHDVVKYCGLAFGLCEIAHAAVLIQIAIEEDLKFIVYFLRHATHSLQRAACRAIVGQHFGGGRLSRNEDTWTSYDARLYALSVYLQTEVTSNEYIVQREQQLLLTETMAAGEVMVEQTPFDLPSSNKASMQLAPSVEDLKTILAGVTDIVLKTQYMNKAMKTGIVSPCLGSEIHLSRAAEYLQLKSRRCTDSQNEYNRRCSYNDASKAIPLDRFINMLAGAADEEFVRFLHSIYTYVNYTYINTSSASAASTS